MTIAEAQTDFCKLIRAKEAPSCITPERIIFITDATSEIYIADDWYMRLPDEKIAEYREAYRKRGLDIDGRPLQVSSATSSSSSDEIPSVDFQPIESEEEKARKAAIEAEKKASESRFEQTYDGVPYAEIVKALVELMGGAPAHGARNNFIYREACLLRYICNSEAAWIKDVILTFGEDEQKAFATVESACKVNQMAVMPDIVRQAVELTRKRFIAQQATQKAGIYADVPPQMPDRLPRLIKLLTSKVSEDFKSAIAVTQKFFSVKEVADGAVSRLNLCTIIRDDFAPRPVVGEYDGVFKAALRPYTDSLNGAHGVVDCKKARQLAERLEAEIMEIAQLADNKSYAEFAKRALANGYRKAMVLYLANGERWEKSIEDFIEWSVKYDLWCKMRFFGMKMDEAIDSDRRLVNHSGPNNLLSFVPDTFSLMDIQAVYQMQGKKGRLTALLAMWVKRGHIVKNADGTYSKTERFIAKYGHYGTPMVA